MSDSGERADWMFTMCNGMNAAGIEAEIKLKSLPATCNVSIPFTGLCH